MEVVRLAAFVFASTFAIGQTSVEGHVLSDAGEPLSKATLTLIRSVNMNMGTTPYVPGGARTSYAETDEAGKFAFPDLVLGQYRLEIQRTGFVTKTRDITLWVTPGQALKNLEFKLFPQAVITGRFTDRDGDPAGNTAVNAYRESYGRTGKRWLLCTSTSTDENGNFRLSGLAPGRYSLMGAIVPAGERFGITVLYPNEIVVPPGAELHGMDIRESADRTRYTVRGKVVDMTTGALVRTQFLTLKPRDGRDYGGANSAVKSDGSFEFRSVAPGTYYARTVLSTTNWNNLGELEVTVGNGDVEGAVLGIHPIMKIDGTVKAESGDLTRMPFVRLVPLGIPFNGTDPGGQAGADGSFQLDNVGPVQYFVEMHGLPEEMYVKSIRFRDRDVTHSPLDLTRGAGGGLDIVLAAHAASVNGTAEPNAAVAVWSSEDAHTVITDAKGAFHFGSLAPGEYRILAWDDIEPGIAEYAPYRERFNSRATAITLREDSKLTQEVITIPHDQAQAEQERIP